MNMWAVLRATPFFRFILSGGINTVVTYGIYLALLELMSYQFSYAISYVTGIAFSYALNRTFVFRSHRGISSVLLLPLVYLVQYGVGVAVLWLCVDVAGISARAAPLAVIAITVPMTFVLTRYAFMRSGDEGLKE